MRRYELLPAKARSSWRANARVALMAAASFGSVSPAQVAGQVIRGRVLDEIGGNPVAQAVVRVLDADSEALVASLADSLGRYRLELPSPGEFYLSAERLGYEPTRSPLLAVVDSGGEFVVDLSVRVSPLDIPGIEVTAERFAEINQRLRLLVGVSPTALRVQPIMRPEIENHLDRSHNVTDLIRWKSIPSLEIRNTDDGPCFLIRRGSRVRIPDSCAPVLVNGVPLVFGTVESLPLDMVEVIVVTMPLESILHPMGAILLYTAGWIG